MEGIMLENILKYQETESNILAAETEFSKSKEREKGAAITQESWRLYATRSL